MASILVIVGGVALVLVFAIIAAYLVGAYNSLVRLNRRVDQAKQNVDVKLAERQDSLSKLVDAVAGYLDHEETVLARLTAAREAAAQAETPAEEAAADARVREALATFEARAEEYPELRSTENVQHLQAEITRLEAEISDRREFYNDSVTLYNTRIAQFPHLLFANAMGYAERELFEASEAQTGDVDVSAAFDDDETDSVDGIETATDDAGSATSGAGSATGTSTGSADGTAGSE